jgi:NADH:ubiquinone oxidoreductase subunit 6 (subunit J)
MELWIFLIVGAVAVAAAVAMLLSSNAVYSAMCLILNFACVAVLYILLEAPFLAMVQIAVYAGAIMVLFLFVIMLLGAEKLSHGETKFRWLPVAALVLSAMFLLTVGLPIVSENFHLPERPGGAPALRVINVAPDVDPLDVYADGELIASNVEFRGATEFIPLPPGEHAITLRPTGLASDLLSSTLTLESAPEQSVNPYTAIIFGEGPFPTFTLVDKDFTAAQGRNGRLVFFNAYTESPSVSVVDLRSEFDANDTVTIAADIPQGEASDPQPIAEGTKNWVFITGQDENNILYRLRDFEVERETSELVILTGERLFDNTLRAIVVPFLVEAVPEFGGPEVIGQAMFARYLLPFELVSILLLVAIIGAIILTQRDHIPAIRRRDVRRRVSRPLTSVIAAQTGHDVTEATNGQKQPETMGE